MINLFENFKDIDVKDQIIAKKSDLEKVLEIEEEIVTFYKENNRFSYPFIYKIMQKKLADITVTSTLLQTYIDARENKDLTHESILRGMYSGALLEIICTTQPDTITIIDGKNKTFNYLFYLVHNVNNLLLKNIKGDCILRLAGANKGSARYITLYNITGTSTLLAAGKNKGIAEYITLNKIMGDWTLGETGQDGGIAQNITINNIKGDYALNSAGRYGGIAQNLTLNNVRGKYILEFAGFVKGTAQKILLRKVNKKGTLERAGEQGGSAQQILRENEFSKEQKIIFSEIQKIVKKIHTLPAEKYKTAHDKIAWLQKEIFTGEEK